MRPLLCLLPWQQGECFTASDLQNGWPCSQMNERYLRWDASAQRQLIMIWVAQQLDVTTAELEGATRLRAGRVPDNMHGKAPFGYATHLQRCWRAAAERVAELGLLLPDLYSKLDKLQVGMWC